MDLIGDEDEAVTVTVRRVGQKDAKRSIYIEHWELKSGRWKECMHWMVMAALYERNVMIEKPIH